MKYALAMQFDSSVAMPTPSTSCPRGSRTNMNSGSRAMLIRPPAITPALAWRERPALRRMFDMAFENTVGMPPSTTTQNVYWLA